jgi:Fibronectin type III domain
VRVCRIHTFRGMAQPLIPVHTAIRHARAGGSLPVQKQSRIHGGPLKIYSLKRMTIPKIAVLATGLTAAILAATISPQAAQATPSEQAVCTGCHGAGSAPGFMQITLLGLPTMAPSTDYAIKIDMATNSNNGNSGWWIANSDAEGVTGTTASVCRTSGSTPAPAAPLCYGGPAGSTTFFPSMTSPATAGTYWYKVFMNQGAPAASETYSALFSITVTAPPTTVPPTTVPPTTVPPTTVPPTTVPPTTVPPTTVPPTTVPPTTVPPVITAPGAPTGVTAIPGNGLAVVSWTPSTTGDPATSYTVTASPGGRTVTTTGTSATVTGLTNGTSYTFTVTAANSAGTSVVSAASAAVTPSASITGVVPVGAPSTGAGGASTSGDSPLMGLGGLALLLAGAAMVPAIRRRRRV